LQTTRTNIKNIGKAEFMSLFHQYQGESLCSKKLSAYANQIQNPEMKNVISQMSTQCQERATRLQSFLQESGGSQLLS
jgi:ferritin-like metal-binding protein YciE